MKPYPKKMHYRLVYLALGEAISQAEDRNRRSPGVCLRLNGDQWTTSFYASQTHDPMDSQVILICEKGWYVERDANGNALETIQYAARVGDLFKDWGLPVTKSENKAKTKV